MNRVTRRSVLGIGATTLFASAAGCLSRDDGASNAGSPTDDSGGNDENGSGFATTSDPWTYETSVSLETVAEGLVLGREDFREGTGGIVALDIDTGDHRWGYGESGGFTGFFGLLVDDGIYAGFGDDAVGSASGSVHALEFDGDERWTADTGSVYQRPLRWNDFVLTGSDDGNVWALEADTGDTVWTIPLIDGKYPGDPTVEAVDDDVIYATADGTVVALEAATGEELWQTDVDENRVRTFYLDDGHGDSDDGPPPIYFSTYSSVGRLVDGDLDWQKSLESAVSVQGLEAGTLYATQGYDVLALDPSDGSIRWTESRADRRALLVTENGVFFATDADEVRARNHDSDRNETDQWTTAIDDEIKWLQAAADGLYVVTESGLTRVSWNGEVDASAGIESIRSVLVADDRVVVATREETYGLGPDLELPV
ncbi:PQQ-binding-like beta-propeller repeat protein [Natrialbaceae archaeon A-CW3]